MGSRAKSPYHFDLFVAQKSMEKKWVMFKRDIKAHQLCFLEPKLFGFLLIRRFQSGKIMPIGAHSSPAPVRQPPRLVSEVHRLQDGLKSSFDSRFVIEEIPSKRDMASNHELEVIQCTTKIKAQVPLSSSGGGLNLQSWASICLGWRFWYLSYKALSGLVAERGNHPWR